MPTVPRRVEDLPFVRRPPLALLNLHEDRELPDPDFAGFGWGRVHPLTLRAAQGPDVRVPAALVLALHSADEQPADSRTVELEFDVAVGPGPDDYVAILVPLSVFLTQRLAGLLAEEPVDDVVLALCNAEGRPVQAPDGLGAARLWWADGDVESWLEPDATGHDRIVLKALRWHVQSRGAAP